MMKGYMKGPEDRVGYDSISSSFEQSKFAVTIPECLNAIDYNLFRCRSHGKY